MISIESFNNFCYIWLFAGLCTFLLLQFVNAPYGRHIKKGWGLVLSNNIGWFLMELPSFLIILLFLLQSKPSTYATLLALLWLLHYFNRTFVFPFRIKTSGKKIPLVIVLSAVLFNFVNAGINGYYFYAFESYTNSDFLSWNFLLGIGLFLFGFIGNQISDAILINLRKRNERGYHIPHGFFFKYVSCPNHMFEIIEWGGFALMAWNLPGLCFFIWTCANLIPRARKHHKWYLKNFPDYPLGRKSIFPFLL